MTYMAYKTYMAYMTHKPHIPHKLYTPPKKEIITIKKIYKMKKLFMMLMLFAPLATFAQQKFGHINAQEVMASMPEFIKVRGEIEATAKQYENDLKAMQDELQRKAQEYDKSKSTMNETKQKETEQTLMDLQQKIQQAYQDNSQALQKAQNEKMAPITQRLVNAIQAVGKAGGYVYIMDTQMGIPYVSETLSKDVTAEVKAELNKPSAAKKK